MTLLSNWGEKNPQFSPISALALLVLLKKARVRLVRATQSLFDLQLHYKGKEVILNINGTGKE